MPGPKQHFCNPLTCKNKRCQKCSKLKAHRRNAERVLDRTQATKSRGKQMQPDFDVPAREKSMSRSLGTGRSRSRSKSASCSASSHQSPALQPHPPVLQKGDFRKFSAFRNLNQAHAAVSDLANSKRAQVEEEIRRKKRELSQIEYDAQQLKKEATSEWEQHKIKLNQKQMRERGQEIQAQRRNSSKHPKSASSTGGNTHSNKVDIAAAMRAIALLNQIPEATLLALQQQGQSE